MNDVDLLILAVERDPYNPIPAGMLTDELMEARDMIRSEADKHVVHVQLAAINALEVATVANLFATPGKPRDRVEFILSIAWPETAHDHATVIVVPGEQPPMHMISDGTGLPNAIVDWITVGARYILARTPAEVIEEARGFGRSANKKRSKKRKR